MAGPAPGQAPARPPGGDGNILTRRIGPLSTWIWLLIGTIAVVGVAFIMSKRQAKQAQQAQPGQTAGIQDVPDIIIQNQQPPVAPPAAPVAAPSPVTVPPGPAPAAPPKPPRRPVPIFNASYRVRKGDTLDSVARKFGVSRVQLAHANGLGTGAGLRTNQTLKVPSPAPGGRPNPAQ